MKAIPYGLLADVDVSSHSHVPSNDAGRGCSCLQGLSFNETIFTWVDQICVVPGPSQWLCSFESV